MNMFEEARALKGMISMCSLTQSEIAKKMGVSQSYVANKIRLLNFSDYIQMLILDASLSERHARVLLKIKGEGLQKTAIEKIKAMRLNVAASEALIDNMVLDELSCNIKISPAARQVEKFEDLISEGVKTLLASGFKVSKSSDRLGKKRFVTVCIED